MKFLFKNILIFTNKNIAERISSLLEIRSIKGFIFNTETDYKNMLEKINSQQEFAVSIYEIKKESKNEIIRLIDRYPTVKFIFLHNANLSVSDIYEIIINGAVDVMSSTQDPHLIIAKVIALFRAEFKKTKKQKITSLDGSTILDTENFKITVDNKDYKLTKKQTAILAILISNEGKKVERYKIASIVYSEKLDRVTPQIIDKHIQMLKDAVPPLASKIKSIWGTGYIYEGK